MSEDRGQQRVIQAGDLMEYSRHIRPAFSYKAVEVRMKVQSVPEGLDGGDDARHKIFLVLEEDTQHLGNGEDDLTMRDIQEKLLAHPLAPLLNLLGVAGRTEAAAAAGKHQQALFPTVWAPDAGKPAARVAAV